MPAPTPRTRQQLKFYARQRLTQAHNGQNDATRALEALDALIDGTYNPADDGAPNAGGASAGSFAALTGAARSNVSLAAALDAAANTFPNDRPDFRKVVAYESAATSGYTTGRSTIADILATSALHTQVVIEFDDQGRYGRTKEFVYDGAPRTGAASPGLRLPREFGSAATLPVKLIPVEEVTPNVPAYDPAFNQPAGYPIGYEVRYTPAGGVEGHWVADVANPSAAPGLTTGQWHQVAPPVAGSQPTASLTEVQLVNLYNNQALGTYTGKLLFITNRAGGLGSVAVEVLGSGALALDDAYLFDPANADAPAVPVVLAVTTTTTTTVGRGGTTRAVFTFDRGGNSAGFDTLDAALAYGTTDYTHRLNRGSVTVQGAAVLDEATIDGQTSWIEMPTGRSLTLTNGASVYDALLYGDGTLRVDSPGGALRRCGLSMLLTQVLAGATLTLDNVRTSTGMITVAGTLVLRPGTDVSASTITTTGAGVVVDERGAAADTFSVLTYAASIAIDFNAASVRTLAATGNVAFTAAANIALLKTKELYITNTTGAAITLSFPTGWSFFPGPAPTSLAAGGEAALYLRCLGTNDSSIKARFIVGTSGTPATAPTVSNASFTAA